MHCDGGRIYGWWMKGNLMRYENLLTLEIAALPTHDGPGRMVWHLGDRLLPVEGSVTLERWRELHRLVDAMRQLLKHVVRPDRGTMPEALDETLAGVGFELFDIWLRPGWEAIRAAGWPQALLDGAPAALQIHATDPEVLLLPWEAVRIPDGPETLHVRRQLSAPVRSVSPAHCPALPSGPLRVLFAFSMPAHERDAERVGVLRALSRVGEQSGGDTFQFEILPVATLAEMEHRIGNFRPHLVHWVAPVWLRDGTAVVGLMDEHDSMDPRTADEIAALLLRDRELQCVLVAGQEESPGASGGAVPIAATHAVCAAWSGQQAVPYGLAWPGPFDERDTEAALHAFYAMLAGGQTLADSLLAARRKLIPPRDTLPVLYGSSCQRYLCNLAPDAVRVAVGSPCPLTSSVVSLLDLTREQQREVARLPGRRGEINRLSALLLQEKANVAWVVGPAGAGKSVLAAHVAIEVAAGNGMTVVRIAGTAFNPVTAVGILQGMLSAMADLGLREEIAILKDASILVEDRLHFLVQVLYRRAPFMLIIDHLEFSLDHSREKCSDPHLDRLLRLLVSAAGPASLSRVLVCIEDERSVVALAGSSGRMVRCSGLEPGTFLSLLLCDRQVNRHYVAGAISFAELGDYAGHFQYMPTLLPLLRYAIRVGTMPPIAAIDEVAAGGVPAMAVKLFRDVLSDASFHALRYAAILNLPMPLEAYAAVTGLSMEAMEEEMMQWHMFGLVKFSQTRAGQIPHWIVPAPFRAWLTSPGELDDEHARTAHQMAGDVLLRYFENNEERVLGIPWTSLLLEARGHYLMANEIGQALAVSDRISVALHIQGFFAELEHINWHMTAYTRHPSPMNWLGHACLAGGQTEKAIEWFRQGHRAARNVGSVESELAALHGMAEAHMAMGNDQEARQALEAGCLIYRSDAVRAADAPGSDLHPEREGVLLQRLAQVLWRQHEVEGATRCLQDALECHRQHGNRMGEASVLEELAAVLSHTGDRAGAGVCLETALECRQRAAEEEGVEDPVAVASVLAQLGMLALEQGQSDVALEHLEAAIALHHGSGEPVPESYEALATVLPIAGHLHFVARHLEQARARFGEALPLLRDMQQRPAEASVLHQLATIDIMEQEPRRAWERLQEALAIKTALRAASPDQPHGESATLFQFARILKEHDHLLGTLQVLSLCQQIDDQDAMAHGHTHSASDATQEQRILDELADELRLDEQEVRDIRRETWHAYQRDHGRGLLERLAREVWAAEGSD
jgi:tetratricopeptide (TPR) repeat protein